MTIPRYARDYSLGSTSLTTDDSGNVGARQAYYPFGATRWVTGTLPTGGYPRRSGYAIIVGNAILLF